MQPTNCMNCATSVAVTVLMSRLDPLSLAAHQIAMNMASLTFMVPLGISASAAIRVGLTASTAAANHCALAQVGGYGLQATVTVDAPDSGSGLRKYVVQSLPVREPICITSPDGCALSPLNRLSQDCQQRRSWRGRC